MYARIYICGGAVATTGQWITAIVMDPTINRPPFSFHLRSFSVARRSWCVFLFYSFHPLRAETHFIHEHLTLYFGLNHTNKFAFFATVNCQFFGLCLDSCHIYVYIFVLLFCRSEFTSTSSTDRKEAMNANECDKG